MVKIINHSTWWSEVYVIRIPCNLPQDLEGKARFKHLSEFKLAVMINDYNPSNRELNEKQE